MKLAVRKVRDLSDMGFSLPPEKAPAESVEKKKPPAKISNRKKRWAESEARRNKKRPADPELESPPKKEIRTSPFEIKTPTSLVFVKPAIERVLTKCAVGDKQLDITCDYEIEIVYSKAGMTVTKVFFDERPSEVTTHPRGTYLESLRARGFSERRE